MEGLLMRGVRYYSSFEEDFSQSADQNYKLSADYKWIRTDLLSRLLSGAVYGLAVIVGAVYCKLVLRMRITGRKNLRGCEGDFFIYCNHTQPVGDVFIPALCVLPRRIYTLVSPANYGIPVIGKILPFLGALPISRSLHDVKKLNDAIEYHLKAKHPIAIYPEAHVWEYYTEIRPYSDVSFRFPVKFDKPCFAFTVTYKKARFFKRPIMNVYIDGPFYAQGSTLREKSADLHREVYSAMRERAKNSNCQYIKYTKKD